MERDWLARVMDILRDAREGRPVARSEEQARLAAEAVKACRERPAPDAEWAKRLAEELAEFPAD